MLIETDRKIASKLRHRLSSVMPVLNMLVFKGKGRGVWRFWFGCVYRSRDAHSWIASAGIWIGMG